MSQRSVSSPRSPEALRRSVEDAIARRRGDDTLLAPQPRQVAFAGAVAVVGSLVAAIVLAQIGAATFSYPAEFDKFRLPGYAVLTVGGVIGATLAWLVVSRYAPEPRPLLARLAVIVTVVLLLPDFWLFTQPGNPTGPVLVLIVMHVVIAVVAYYTLVGLAPVTSARRSPRP